MPYFPTAQAWLDNSTLLLSARPTTTRITTKYTIARPPPPSIPTETPTPQPPQSKAHLILKTYDPVSGTCLKYRTDKAAEVGRLVGALGRCGRVMAGVPEREGGEEILGEEKTGKGEGDGGEEGEDRKVGGKEVGKGVGKDGKAVQGKPGVGGGGGAGGGKKKKGKK